jgi:hypothetical protein
MHIFHKWVQIAEGTSTIRSKFIWSREWSYNPFFYRVLRCARCGKVVARAFDMSGDQFPINADILMRHEGIALDKSGKG